MKIFAMVSMANSLEFTKHALRTFFENTQLDSQDRFILIDNDNSISSDQFKIDPLEILKNPSLLGFSQNANQMIELALQQNADLYFLNNDIIFSKNWLIPFLKDEPVILSPITNREARYSTSQTNTPSDEMTGHFVARTTMELTEYVGREKAFEFIAEAHCRQATGYLDVLALPFCCVKLPLTVMQGVGFFDESFGKGGAEDYDYALRAYLGGFKVQYALKSYVLHFGGRSSWSSGEGRETTLAREHLFRSAFRKKWGQKLYDLIVDEIDTSIKDNIKVQAMIKAQDLKGVLELLVEDPNIAVKIMSK